MLFLYIWLFLSTQGAHNVLLSKSMHLAFKVHHNIASVNNWLACKRKASSSIPSRNRGQMGLTEEHFADDEARLLKQMSLHPLNTKLNSETCCLSLSALKLLMCVPLCVRLCMFLKRVSKNKKKTWRFKGKKSKLQRNSNHENVNLKDPHGSFCTAP